MILRTFQDKHAYYELQQTGYLRAPKDESLLFADTDTLIQAYNWLCEQMTRRIGTPPKGVKYPVWSWHTYGGKYPNVDTNLMKEYESPIESKVMLTIDVPDELVLLTDYEKWHMVLNDAIYIYDDNLTDEEFDKEWTRINVYYNLHPDEKRKYWERIIFQTEHDISEAECKYVQATVWEIKSEWIQDVEIFS